MIAYEKNENADTITYPKASVLPKLQMLEIEITLRCPLRCIHCSVNGGESKIDIPIEKFYEIVEDCEKIGVEVLDIIGGEPIAYPHIYEAIRYAVKRIPKVYLNTAGYFINEKIIEKLKDTGLKDIFVSIDGATAEKHEKIRGHGTFQKTCESVKRLSEHGFTVTVSFVANAENYKDIPDILKICETYGAKRLFILSLIPEGRGKNLKNIVLKDHMIIEIIKELRKYKGPVEIELDCSIKTDFSEFPEYVKICPAGTSFCTIKSDGSVIPCGFLPSNFLIGNIYEKRFYDIWIDNIKFYYWRNPLKGCENCSIYKECRGGCQALKIGKVCEGIPQNRKYIFYNIRTI